jgi:hypothetical protein
MLDRTFGRVAGRKVCADGNGAFVGHGIDLLVVNSTRRSADLFPRWRRGTGNIEDRGLLHLHGHAGGGFAMEMMWPVLAVMIPLFVGG